MILPLTEEDKLIEEFKKEKRRKLREEYLNTIRKVSEEQNEMCLEATILWGMPLSRGDVIEVSIKGRGKEDVVGTFQCYNPHYATLLIETEEYEMAIKLRDIKFIKRVFTKFEKKKEEEKKVVDEESLKTAEGIKKTLGGSSEDG